MAKKAKITYKIGDETRYIIVSLDMVDEWVAEYDRIGIEVTEINKKFN